MTVNLKKIYQSKTEGEPLLTLESFSCPSERLVLASSLYNPEEVYMTNAVESLNIIIRRVIKKRKRFPTDKSASEDALLSNPGSKRWAMPIKP